MAGDSAIQEQRKSGNGQKGRGGAVRATIGAVLAAVLGLVSSFGLAGLGLDAYGPALTWVIIGWTLLGMVIVGLWPVLTGIERTRPRVGLACGAFAALTALSVWSVALGRPGDGIDPIAQGCRYLHGTHQTSASSDIARSWGIIGNFTLVHNPHPQCGVVWAQFLTPKGDDLKRPPFRDMRIASISLDIVRRDPAGRQTRTWNYDTAPPSEVDNRDIWTPALRLEDGVYEANLGILFAGGEPANVHLTWDTDKPSIIGPRDG
ncbi:hypothetical protein FXF51_17945 [Nonomuraea sp. PA05]|uniref:hypothetical protein n=1 Tax=Nonomuraea sp. PA05 TaxID=2604466 RepID=UPI0011DC6394|nr:hypothetical protein [Nonomuraea sp. PA05]TYB66077.1 hypothetical protein FXF51_17945 [Nonomuraea sp. PA05]